MIGAFPAALFEFHEVAKSSPSFKDIERAEIRGAKIAVAAIGMLLAQGCCDRDPVFPGSFQPMRRRSSNPHLRQTVSARPFQSELGRLREIEARQADRLKSATQAPLPIGNNVSGCSSGSQEKNTDRQTIGVQLEPRGGGEDDSLARPVIRFHDDDSQRVVELDGKAFHVKSSLSWIYLKAVVEANGGIVKSSELSKKFNGGKDFSVTRACGGLPPKFQSLIWKKGVPGGGSRLMVPVTVVS